MEYWTNRRLFSEYKIALFKQRNKDYPATFFRKERAMPKVNGRIEINPAVCHGKPVVRGTRVMVSRIIGALAGGDSIEDVLSDYPSMSRGDLRAVLSFAGDGGMR